VRFETIRKFFAVGQSMIGHGSVAYTPFGIQPTSVIAGVQSFLVTLMSVNHSPVYFLHHLVFLTVVVFVVRMSARHVSPVLSGAAIGMLAVVCLIYADYFQTLQTYIPGNVLAVVSAGLALVYEIFFAHRVQKIKSQHAGIIGVVTSIVVMLVIGYVQWLQVSWYMLPAIFFLYVRDSLYVPSQGFFKKIAHLGRAYSFGIFAWHYFFLIVFSAIAKNISFPQHELAVFVSTTILGLLTCTLWVMVCYRVSWLRWMVVL
jgi:peptidoglycan/LPS O-acetylase OafA/YrhL